MRLLGYALLLAPLLVGLAGEPAQARDNNSRDVSKRCNQIADARDLDGSKRRDFLKDCKSSSNNDLSDWVGGIFGKDDDDGPPVDDKTDWCMDQARQHGMRNGYAFNNYVKQCKNRN